MQLIWPHKVFCLLRDIPVLWRQQLRAHRSVQHVIEHPFQLLVFRLIRRVFHKMAHQRLRHGRIHTVHGHMVPVVSRPAERKLRHIPGPDHHAACPVRDVHQHLGALPRLRVFISHIMLLRILADIPEVYLHRLCDGHLSECRPCLLRHLAGILVRAVRCPEAGHGHCDDILLISSEHVKGTGSHKKRQGRVKPP